LGTMIRSKSIFGFLLTVLGLFAMGAETSRSNSTDALIGIELGEMKLVNGRYSEILEDNREVTFTVDPALQSFADDLFAKYQVPAGAAVLLNSKTGRVLALSQQRSFPDFAASGEVALDSSPPAASLFKIVTASALLEKGGVTADTNTCYRGGSQKLVMENLLDAPREKSACANLRMALGRSINAVFAKLSDRLLNRDILLNYAERFGFNKAIPFDVPIANSTAEIPGDRLERARAAAGFWHVHMSPLHAAMIVQSLAQKGSMLRPYIVERVQARG
jgi:peptidoglycan glycosyltransferase